MSFPLSTPQVLVYVGWLLHTRKVQPDTASRYLSGLSMAHMARGLDIPLLRHPCVRHVLAGAQHLLDAGNIQQGKPARRAMTFPLMLILAHRIATSGWSEHKKQLVWTVSTLALFGAFRVGELLPQAAGSFDSRFTLLAKEVTLHHLHMPDGDVVLARVFIKSPKVRIGVGDQVEVFALGSNLCPVAAINRYKDLSKNILQDDLPFFRQESGSNYYKQLFNKHLKTLLQKDIHYEAGDRVTSHSFRAGISSYMHQWGFAAEEIQGWGRWSSQAYEKYCKLPRLTCRRLAHQLQQQFDKHLHSSQ